MPATTTLIAQGPPLPPLLLHPVHPEVLTVLLVCCCLCWSVSCSHQCCLWLLLLLPPPASTTSTTTTTRLPWSTPGSSPWAWQLPPTPAHCLSRSASGSDAGAALFWADCMLPRVPLTLLRQRGGGGTLVTSSQSIHSAPATLPSVHGLRSWSSAAHTKEVGRLLSLDPAGRRASCPCSTSSPSRRIRGYQREEMRGGERTRWACVVA